MEDKSFRNAEECFSLSLVTPTKSESGLALRFPSLSRGGDALEVLDQGKAGRLPGSHEVSVLFLRAFS